VRYGAFRRSFRLPQHVTGDDVSAGYDAGILTVRVAGVYAGSTAQRIPVTAGPAPTTEAADEQAAA
jgi:HSP20 family molecular chaperone IbpA